MKTQLRVRVGTFLEPMKHLLAPEPEWVNIAFVWAHRNAAGGLIQSSSSMSQRRDRAVCVIEKERKAERGRSRESQFRFHSSHYSSDTGQCLGLSLRWVTALTTCSEVPHYNSFIKTSVSVCSGHRSYCIWVAVLISVALIVALAQ